VTLDLVVAVAVLVFALLGAMSGFARQVAQAVAGVAAFFAAGPAGRFLGLPVSQKLNASLTTGVVVASVLAFIVIYFSVRLVLAALIRRLIEGRDQPSFGADRLLGALLGGGKAAGMAYLGLCAATFLENNLVVAGKKYSLTPKDSVLVPLVRKYNLLEYQQFSGTSDLAKALKVARNPKTSSRLQGDPDFTAVMKDPRFKNLLNQKALLQALESGDLHGLLSSNQVVELIQDPRMLHHLERVGEHEPDERAPPP
jgi:membrane protein required for colicin V production